MNEVKWIKIVTNIFDDEKIMLIDNLPDGDTILVIWFKLLCLAGKQNNGGVIMLNDKIAYTDEMLSIIFRRNLNTVRLALKTFEEFEMIEIINGAVCISNWSKHQSLESMERVRELNKKRVAKYREKQKILTLSDECNVTCNVTGNVTVTECNSTDKEEDKDKEKENNICSSDDELKLTERKIKELFEECWSYYPRKQGKAEAYKAFKKAIEKGEPYEVILDGVKAYANHKRGTDPQYIKMGDTFFRGKNWNDEYIIGVDKTPDYQSQSDVDDIDI